MTTLLLCLVLLSTQAISQTMFWTEDGGVLKSKDLNTGMETTLLDGTLFNNIGSSYLDKLNQKIFFHVPSESTSADDLMVIDYDGENIKTVGQFANFGTDFVYYENDLDLIFFKENSSAYCELNSVDAQGNIENIRMWEEDDNCGYMTYHFNEKKFYFIANDSLQMMNVDGSNLESIFYAPDVTMDTLFGYSGSNIFWIDPYFKEFYAIDVDFYNSQNTLLKSNMYNIEFDTLFQTSSALDTSGFILRPIIDEINSKLYTIIRNIIVPFDVQRILRRSNMDGSNIEVLDEVYGNVQDYVGINGWGIDPNYSNSSPISSLIHYNSELEEISSSTTQTIPFKVCADGSEGSIFGIKFSSNIDVSNITLRIEEDSTGNDPEQFGSFIQNLEPENDNLRVLYQHPINFGNINAEYRVANIQIVDTSTGSILGTIPLHIYPAPVLMVHGLWGVPAVYNDIYEQLEESPQYTKDLLYKADYTNTNDEEFTVNQNLIYDQIFKYLIPQVENQKIACGKVDVITHSMGGLLTRIYLQNEGLDNQIRKFIGVNVPHSGSQLANMIFDPDFAQGNVNGCEFLEEGLWGTGVFAKGSCYNGGVENLRVDSDAIISLNKNVDLEPNNIFIHSICSTIDPNNLGFELDYLTDEISLTAEDISLIFNMQENDGIVELASQLGGVSASTVLLEADHINILENENAIDTLLDLLIESPQTGLFANKFAPVALTYNHELSNPSSIQTPADIEILEPLEGSIFMGGEEILISIAGDLDINKLAIYFPNSQTGKLEKKEIFGNNGNVTFSASNELLGRRSILVAGYDGQDKLINNSFVTVFVDTEENPISLYLTGRRIFDLGQKEKMVLDAKFGTFEADVNDLEGIEFSFENGLFEQVSGNEIKAIGIGKDVITAKFRGVVSNPINVTVEGSTNTINIGSDFTNNSLTIDNIYPNPGGNDFIVRFNSPKKRDVKISILDFMGSKVFTSSLLALEGENLVDLILPNHLPKGIYLVSIQSESVIRTAKYIKQ